MDKIETLRDVRDAAKHKMEEAWSNPEYTIRHDHWRQAIAKPSEKLSFGVALATREVEYQIAARALLLGEYDIVADPRPMRVLLRPVPFPFLEEGMFVVSRFFDPLAAIDPKQHADFLFIPDPTTSDICRAAYMPKRNQAEWTKRGRHAKNEGDVTATNAAFTEHERLRNLLYGNRAGWYEAMRRHKRPFTRAEYHEC